MKNKKDKAQESCGCGSENCHCGDDCNCTKDNKCSDNCTCDHEQGECGCGHDHGSAEEFKAYKRAFEEFEEALEKIDLELTKEKEKAARAEHLADSYKKDLERYKERNKDFEKESKINASINLATKILPVLDNFEQALKTVKDENVLVGFKMIMSGIKNVLADMGIVEMTELVGSEFNPEMHEAVNRIKTDKNKEDGKIASVYKTGYILKDTDKVIRYAQVEIYTLN